MNVFSLTSGPVANVNPPISGTLKRGAGYTTAGDGSRVPTFAKTIAADFQVQALTGKEIAHLDSLNITGRLQAVHYKGELIALDRKKGSGGDVLTYNGDDWLVVQIIEFFPATGWTRAAIQKQLS